MIFILEHYTKVLPLLLARKGEELGTLRTYTFPYHTRFSDVCGMPNIMEATICGLGSYTLTTRQLAALELHYCWNDNIC